MNVGNTRLVMEPAGEDMPQSPNKKMIMLIALILGAGIPFGIFFMISQLDTRVKTRNDLTNMQVPFLAEIPQLGQGAGILNKMRKKMCDDANTKIVVAPSNRNSINEAFRVLRNSTSTS